MKLLKLLFLITLSFGIAACSGEKPNLKPLGKSDEILAFGDSLTYGTGAKKDDSYPSVLKN